MQDLSSRIVLGPTHPDETASKKRSANNNLRRPNSLGYLSIIFILVSTLLTDATNIGPDRRSTGI
jgi:hypothetical protein